MINVQLDLGQLLEPLLKRIESILPSFFNSYSLNNFKQRISNHHNELKIWSTNIGEKILCNIKEFDTNDSILLPIISEDHNKIQNINEILQNKLNVIIGPPGAGKTTSIKQLLNNIFSDEKNKFIPVLVELKYLNDNTKNISNFLCEIFNIPYEVRLEEYIIDVNKEIYESELNFYKMNLLNNGICDFDLKKIEYPTFNNSGIYDKYYGTNTELNENKYILKYEQKKQRERFYINKITVFDFIKKIIDEKNIILILDGLDEINFKYVDNFKKEIDYLLESNCKIILSSRFDFEFLCKFKKWYINPLDENRINQIIQLIAKNPMEFQDLKFQPYYNLCNRPLFLAYIINYVNQNIHLPLNEVDVYEYILQLILSDWDITRDIDTQDRTPTKFIRQDAKKILVDLAYRMSLAQSVNYETLFTIFKELAVKYTLNVKDFNKFLEELEIKHGLIEKRNSYYSFSHINIQEYLCSFYIRDNQNSKQILDFFFKKPFIISLSLKNSTDPTSLLVSLFLNEKINESNFYNSLRSILPTFINSFDNNQIKYLPSIEIGLVCFQLMNSVYISDNKIYSSINKFINMEVNLISLQKAIIFYIEESSDDKNSYYTLNNYSKLIGTVRYQLSPPNKFYCPLETKIKIISK